MPQDIQPAAKGPGGPRSLPRLDSPQRQANLELLDQKPLQTRARASLGLGVWWWSRTLVPQKHQMAEPWGPGLGETEWGRVHSGAHRTRLLTLCHAGPEGPGGHGQGPWENEDTYFQSTCLPHGESSRASCLY